MVDKISTEEFALVQSCLDNASLRSKIVQSPDKLQRALEEKRLVQTKAKDAERAAMQSFQDKIAMLEAYAKVTSRKSVEKEVKVLKNKLSDEGVMIKSLEAKLVELQSKADQLKEPKRQLEKERAILHEEVDNELNHMYLEMESKKLGLELRQRVVESVVAEADAITSKIKTIREGGEAEMQELGCKCEEILAEFEKYSTSISNLLAATGLRKEVVDGKRS